MFHISIYDPQKDLELFSFGELEGEIIKKKKVIKDLVMTQFLKLKILVKLWQRSHLRENEISHRAKSTQEMLKHLNHLYK